jgi:acetolactate synthase-1/2/3 large subunit
VKLAEAYGGVGIRCDRPGDLDAAITEMINVDRPVIFDCVVDKTENCFPMIPSGKAHNEMLLNDYLGETGAEDLGSVISAEGKMLV